MRVDVYLPILLSLLLAAISPLVGRRVAPALAARVLTVSAVFTAAATVWSLVLLAATLVGQVPQLVAAAQDDGRRPPDPVPGAIALAAVPALLLVAVRVYRAARAERGTRRALRALCAGHPADTELVVAASPLPQAFAIPGDGGVPGRILVTSGMLCALEPAERRVLLAHERAHLTHRHARMSTAVALAAAADPLLAPVRVTVAFLVERWADEQAADAVGDRTTTARALARAALTAGRRPPSCALGFARHAVTRRVAALQAGPLPPLWPLAAATLALGALPALGALDATRDLLRLLEHVLG
ncbi:M48 family metalloprotease [Streptomyces sp. NPDC007264]|uniref:M48 family metalloprotease n=1 Tax=Streptomyces sp. NPDC007264 TaxID=3364777 RepID=UPI0036DC594B